MDSRDRVKESYEILESLKMENNLYLASSSSDYNYVWLRDSFYEVMPYLDKDDGVYESTYHAILDILNSYSWKFDVCSINKPYHVYEYIHPRYTTEGKETHAEWGNCQHDAIGCILFGIAKGEKQGKKIIRNKQDFDTVQNIVFYLNLCQYWNDADNGMWEEGRDLHMSSVGAVVAGLKEIQGIVTVSDRLIERGQRVINELFPKESPTRDCDLSQLSLIYPYNLLNREETINLIIRVENKLLRRNGVIRYEGDSYYNSEDVNDRYRDTSNYYGKEAEWTFGLPWLALCHMTLNNLDEAEHYIKQAERVMLDDGSLPELYFADSDEYNGNTPLGWSNALFIIAKEKLAYIREGNVWENKNTKGFINSGEYNN